MSAMPFHERLRELLEQAHIDGAVLLVYKEPGTNGKPVVSYKFAINGMEHQEAVGNVLAGVADMLLAEKK